jgi:hypothetical protein
MPGLSAAGRDKKQEKSMLVQTRRREQVWRPVNCLMTGVGCPSGVVIVANAIKFPLASGRLRIFLSL